MVRPLARSVETAGACPVRAYGETADNRAPRSQGAETSGLVSFPGSLAHGLIRRARAQEERDRSGSPRPSVREGPTRACPEIKRRGGFGGRDRGMRMTPDPQKLTEQAHAILPAIHGGPAYPGHDSTPTASGKAGEKALDALGTVPVEKAQTRVIRCLPRAASRSSPQPKSGLIH